jgi:cytochrome c biogenesis protein
MVRRRWSLREERVAGAVHLLAQKGKYGRMGVYVTHLGVVVILLGAALGFALGFKGFVQIHEGETVGRVQDRQSRAWRDLSFQVRCDRFEMAVYPDGTPKEYRSDVAFLQNGQVKLEGPLRVNHPLQFGGYVFYQASYGSSAKVTLEVGKDGGGEVRQATLELGETTGLDPQGQSLIRPMRYESNLQGRGPALLVAYLKAGGQPATGWLFKGDRGAVLEGWNLRFVEAQERRWTGIQVKNDPGVWVVWVGCGLVMLGCALAFLVSHRRIWIRIEEGSGQTTCRVGGSASKNVPGFARKVEELCRVWERRAGLRAMDGRKGNE